MQESMEKVQECERAQLKRINRIKDSVRHRPIHQFTIQLKACLNGTSREERRNQRLVKVHSSDQGQGF